MTIDISKVTTQLQQINEVKDDLLQLSNSLLDGKISVVGEELPFDDQFKTKLKARYLELRTELIDLVTNLPTD